MSIRSSAASMRHRRFWWLLCALVFAVTAGLQVFLAISAAAWWAWAVGVFFALIALGCALASGRST
ncbi:hypothetical protein [Amycolatopsis sp.]|uniref:hypothetical protein n=1 Tax=Amycolatopsis sp. TaxID=37632 RepID=UPI002B87C0A6|nr:hypothetical protein [Amycolatopsis sp.]HVV09429.1 hypothetical protein [Amycolatopsis sp.]